MHFDYVESSTFHVGGAVVCPTTFPQTHQNMPSLVKLGLLAFI